MSQRTIVPTTIVPGGTAVTFAEGDFASGSTDFVFEGTFIADDGTWVPIIPDTMISGQTAGGFTFTNGMNGSLRGIASDYGTAEEDEDIADNAIVTLAQMKLYLGLATDNIANDVFLKFWINQVSDAIERKTRGKVKLQSLTGVILDGNGSYKIEVPYPPIAQVGTGASAALSDIQVRDDPESAWEDIETASTANFLIGQTHSEKNWIKLYDEVFPVGIQNIKLNYKAGYATIPGEIVRVAIETVANILHGSPKDDGVYGQGSNSFSQTMSSISSSGPAFIDFTKEHEAILKPYIWRGLGLFR